MKINEGKVFLELLVYFCACQFKNVLFAKTITSTNTNKFTIYCIILKKKKMN
jgi:hypothetical protein